jgi:hypothetical protein
MDQFIISNTITEDKSQVKNAILTSEIQFKALNNKYIAASNLLCPISVRRIDNHVARWNAVFTLMFLSVFVISGNILPVVFLLLDFILRSGRFSRMSPIAFISKTTLRVLEIQPNVINAGPKIFAVRIGIIFNVLIILFWFIQLYSMAFFFTGIFGLCAFLESVFDYCVACRIYPFVFRFVRSKESV